MYSIASTLNSKLVLLFNPCRRSYSSLQTGRSLSQSNQKTQTRQPRINTHDSVLHHRVLQMDPSVLVVQGHFLFYAIEMSTSQQYFKRSTRDPGLGRSLTHCAKSIYGAYDTVRHISQHKQDDRLETHKLQLDSDSFVHLLSSAFISIVWRLGLV